MKNNIVIGILDKCDVSLGLRYWENIYSLTVLSIYTFERNVRM